MRNYTLSIIHYTFIFIAGAMMISCTPDTECRQDEHVRCKVVFYKTVESQTPYAFDSLTVQGVGSDSILYDNAKDVSTLSLPLRNDTHQTQYHISDGATTETLTIYHTPAPYFVSMACGCFVFHTIDSVQTTGTLLGSSEIVNTAVQNIEDDNIKLFLSTPLP